MLCGGIFDVDGCEKRSAELEAQMGQPSFWDDPDSSQVVIQENKALKRRLEFIDREVVSVYKRDLA